MPDPALGSEGMGQEPSGPGQPPGWGTGQGSAGAMLSGGEIQVRVRELFPKAWQR